MIASYKRTCLSIHLVPSTRSLETSAIIALENFMFFPSPPCIHSIDFVKNQVLFPHGIVVIWSGIKASQHAQEFCELALILRVL